MMDDDQIHGDVIAKLWAVYGASAVRLLSLCLTSRRSIAEGAAEGAATRSHPDPGHASSCEAAYRAGEGRDAPQSRSGAAGQGALCDVTWRARTDEQTDRSRVSPVHVHCTAASERERQEGQG